MGVWRSPWAAPMNEARNYCTLLANRQGACSFAGRVLDIDQGRNSDDTKQSGR